MPTQKGNQPVNTFVKGLITEVSPLSFPEDASLDEVNFKLKRDGTRERRLGINLEENYVMSNVGINTNELPSATQSVFHWPSPNGSAKVDIGVVQVGRYIAFINLLTANPSAHILNGGVVFDTGVPHEALWEFAVINTMLIAVNSHLPRPFLIQYDDVADVITSETLDIQIRDFYGVQDNLDVQVRPTTLSNEHKYNLRNQGWNETIQSTCGTDVLDCTFSTFGLYPSNSDQWGIGRVADLTSADLSKYDPNVAARNIVDGGQVPKGHYIIDLYNRGLSRFTFTGITLPQDRETTFISTVGSYAGRVWYSGIRGEIVNGDDRSPQLSNVILYSQILRNPGDFVKCYQEADPTSYEFNELVDTDGGIISIPEAINIVKLKAIKQSLFVFAENGVWEIRGDDTGFRATSFQVNKISSVGVYSPKSIIEANGTLFFWAISGIYNISPSQQLLGVWDTNNVTLSTIQKLYNSLPDFVKKGAKGYYDFNSNTARWLYTSDNPKLVGDPVDIQSPAPVPFSLGIPPTLVPFGFGVISLDVETLDANTYYIVAVRNTSGNKTTYGIVVKITTGGLIFGSPVQLDTSSTNFNHVSAVSLSPTRAVVVSHSSGSAVVYATLFEVSGTTMVKLGSSILVTSVSGSYSSIKTKVHYVNSTSVVVIYRSASSNLLGGRVISMVGDTLVVGSATIHPFIVTQQLDMEDSASPQQLTALVNGPGGYGTLDVSVSGDVVTFGANTYGSIGLYSGTTDIALAGISSTAYVSAAQNITTGSKIVMSPYQDTGTIDSLLTTVAGFHIELDITSASTVGKIVIVYNTNVGGILGLEIYQYTESSITFLSAHTLTTGEDARSIRIANNGLTPTSAPVAYYDLKASSFAKTFVYDLGSN